MSKKKVYISSTYKDLTAYRDDLKNFFDKQAEKDFDVCEIMEHMYDDYKSTSLLTKCLQEVDKCDIFIIILGCTAGSLPKEGDELTYTEQEYERALQGGKYIARLIYKGCSEEIKDKQAKERYDRFCKKFDDLDVHPFSSIDQFKLAYLEIFYTLLPRLAPVLREENYLSTINRNLQVKRFTTINFKYSTNKVQYFFYRSTEKDHPHYLNFRISDVVLRNHLHDMKITREVRTDFLDCSDNEDEITEFMVNDIAAILLQCEMIKIADLYKFLEMEERIPDELVVPISISHSIETENERLKKLNIQLKKFKEHQNILNKKKIVFLINIEFEQEEITKEQVQLLFSGLNPEGFLYDLGTLKMVTQEEIKFWIKTTFDNSPELIEEYLTRYFKEPFPKYMSVSIDEARDLIKNLHQKK